MQDAHTNRVVEKAGQREGGSSRGSEGFDPTGRVHGLGRLAPWHPGGGWCHRSAAHDGGWSHVSDPRAVVAGAPAALVQQLRAHPDAGAAEATAGALGCPANCGAPGVSAAVVAAGAWQRCQRPVAGRLRSGCHPTAARDPGTLATHGQAAALLEAGVEPELQRLAASSSPAMARGGSWRPAPAADRAQQHSCGGPGGTLGGQQAGAAPPAAPATTLAALRPSACACAAAAAACATAARNAAARTGVSTAASADAYRRSRRQQLAAATRARRPETCRMHCMR